MCVGISSQPTATTETGGWMADELNDVKFFELTRAQVEHEDSLIHYRVTWLLTLQGFLFAAYGLSLGAESTLRAIKGNHPEENIDPYLLAISHARIGFAMMSFLSSIALLIGIAAAAYSILYLARCWDKRTVTAKDAYPQVIGATFPGFGPFAGLIPTYILPLLSSFVWIWLVYDEPLAWIAKLLFVIVTVVFLIGTGPSLGLSSRT